MPYSHINKSNNFHFTLLLSIAETKANKHKEFITHEQDNRRRPPTNEDQRRLRFTISIGVRKMLVILSKSKIHCLPSIFLFLEIKIL